MPAEASADSIVLDASVLIRGLLPPAAGSEAPDWLERVAAGEVRAFVPDLVWAETANALRGYVAAGRISPDEADERLTLALELPLTTASTRLLARQALALATVRAVSAYDGCYLALAVGHDAQLVTADRRLAACADRVVLVDAGETAA